MQQWAGTRASLEDQVIKASDQTPELLVKNLGVLRGYQEQFRKVFGTELSPEGVAKAIAAYERTILSGNAPYDRFRAGDTNALSPAARCGLALFEGKARCKSCHVGFNFTDEGYHNLGVGMDREKPDLGRHAVTKVEGNLANPWLSGDIKPLNLTAPEQADLVAFLESLTGQVAPEVTSPPTLPD